MLQDLYRGALANDKTGTPARTGGQIINDNFAYLDNKITRKDSIVVSTGYAGTPEDKIMNIYWEWIIDTIDYTNPAPVPLNFPYAASGKMRLDMIALTTSNTAIRIAGPESDSNPVSAPLPDNMIQAGLVLVTDSEVGEPSSPVIGDLYVKKIESQDFIFNSGATTVINQIDLIDDRSSISLIGSATDVKSVQLSTAFIRPGKPHFFKNRSGHDVKLWQLAGTGNIKYFFPNGLDLIVKPNEVIEFNTNANDSAYVRFEYVGKEANLDDYYTKEEIDAKLPSNYSQIVYVNSNNPNTATIFDIANPPVTNDDLLKNDVDNLYIGDDSSNWVYNSATLLYETETSVNLLPIEVTGNQTVQESWNGKDVYFMGSGLLTYPNTGLSSGHSFNLYSDIGVTITWAIVAPKTWRVATLTAGTAPPSVTAGLFCFVSQRLGTNEIRVLGL